MKIIITTIIALAASLAQAHSGGTNSSGCHTDHSNGVYHCH